MFCALRFTEDANLSSRVYWYLTDLPLAEGDLVLAPVGVHDKLQRARVERTAKENAPPYDPALCKRVAARAGARGFCVNGVRFFDVGGVRYDDRHYVRFGRAIFSDEEAELSEELLSYGVKSAVSAEGDPLDVLEEIARAEGCILVRGKGAFGAAEELLRVLRGGGDVSAPLRARLYEKFL